MNNIIVGTAGHIDHGKTSLVRAMTGIDTDRLKEEKERGISIDLGFANLKTAEGVNIAFVDVPGHERFVRNMLAGASGIDVVLLVIAADEGVKPQTREHFEICRLLGIERGVVALTKSDAVDAEWLDLMQMEVEEFLAGTFLAGAPVVRVSAKQQVGLDALRAAILQVATTERSRLRRDAARLPVDRAFTMKGHGTVVTGTLTEGQIRVEDNLAVYPGGMAVRVRGVQVHGKAVKQAVAGQRAAVNLAGVEVADVPRGVTLTPEGQYALTRTFDAHVELLAGARPITDRAPVVLHSGAMEVLGELRILEEGRKLAPGAKGWARFVCPTPILILPEDRFVLRSPSPAATIGGGRVVRLRLGALRLRRKGLAAELSEWDAMSMGARILKLAGAAPQGVSWSSVRQTLACATNQIPGEAVQFGDWVATAAGLRTIGAALVADLRQHHHAKPLEVGLSREMLRSRYLVDAPAALLDVVLRLTPAVKVEGECLRLESHRVRLAQDEDAAAKTIEAAFRSAGLAVPSLTEVLAGCGVETQRAQAVLALLLRDGTLRKVTPELVFHRDAVAALKERLATRRGAKMTVNEFKEWTGLSRKYAIPLLEFLDRERVTRRDGEVRIIL